MNREQDMNLPRDIEADPSAATKRPYESPSLTEFGAMSDLTKLDPGPQEDFIAYGGAS